MITDPDERDADDDVTLECERNVRDGVACRQVDCESCERRRDRERTEIGVDPKAIMREN